MHRGVPIRTLAAFFEELLRSFDFVIKVFVLCFMLQVCTVLVLAVFPCHPAFVCNHLLAGVYAYLVLIA